MSNTSLEFSWIQNTEMIERLVQTNGSKSLNSFKIKKIVAASLCVIVFWHIDHSVSVAWYRLHEKRCDFNQCNQCHKAS